MNFQNSPQNKLVQNFISSTDKYFSEEQVVQQFRFFKPHYQIADRDPEIALLVDQFFSFKIFVELFNIDVHINQSMISFSASQLLQFSHNFYQHALYTNQQETVDLTMQFFANRYKQEYEIQYKCEQVNQENVPDGSFQVFQDQQQYNIYFVYFLLLVYMRSARTKLSYSQFIDLTNFQNLTHSSQPLNKSVQRLSPNRQKHELAKSQKYQEINKLQEIEQQISQFQNQLINKDIDQKDLNVQSSYLQPENIVKESTISDITKQQISSEDQLLLQQNQQFIDMQQFQKSSNVLQQLSQSPDQINNPFKPGALNQNQQQNGNQQQLGDQNNLLLINNSKLVMIQNENILLKKQLQDYATVKEQNNNYQIEIQQQNSKLNEYMQQVQHLNLQLVNYQSIKQQNIQLQTVQTQNDESTVQNNQNQMQMKNQLNQINQLQEINSNKSKQLLQLQNQNKQLNDANQIYESQLFKLKNQTSELINVTVNKNQQLVSQINQLQNQIIELNSGNKFDVKSRQQLQDDQNLLQQTRYNEYQQIILGKDQQLNQYIQQINQLKEQFTNINLIQQKNQLLEQQFQQFQLKYKQQTQNYQNQIHELQLKLQKFQSNETLLLNNANQQMNYINQQKQKTQQIMQYYKQIFEKHQNLIKLINNEEDLTQHAIIVNNVTQNQYNKQCVQFVSLQSEYKQLQKQCEQLQQDIIDQQCNNYQQATYSNETIYKQYRQQICKNQQVINQLLVQVSKQEQNNNIQELQNAVYEIKQLNEKLLTQKHHIKQSEIKKIDIQQISDIENQQQEHNQPNIMLQVSKPPKSPLQVTPIQKSKIIDDNIEMKSSSLQTNFNEQEQQLQQVSPLKSQEVVRQAANAEIDKSISFGQSDELQEKTVQIKPSSPKIDINPDFQLNIKLDAKEDKKQIPRGILPGVVQVKSDSDESLAKSDGKIKHQFNNIISFDSQTANTNLVQYD